MAFQDRPGVPRLGAQLAHAQPLALTDGVLDICGVACSADCQSGCLPGRSLLQLQTAPSCPGHPQLAPSSRLLQARAWPKGNTDSTIPFLTNSWVADGVGRRIFFTGAPRLPAETPEGLKKLRQEELDNLRVGLQMRCSQQR